MTSLGWNLCNLLPFFLRMQAATNEISPAGGTRFPIWPWKAPMIPQEELGSVARERDVGTLYLDSFILDLGQVLSYSSISSFSVRSKNVYLDFKVNGFDFRVWSLKVKVTVTSHPCGCDVSGLLLGNFITSGTIHFDSWMTWIEFGGQRLLWPLKHIFCLVNVISQETSQGNSFKIGTHVHLD